MQFRAQPMSPLPFEEAALPLEGTVARALALAGAAPLANILPTLPTNSLVATLQPPAPATTQITKPIANDARIDPLLDNEAFRFNAGSALQTPVTVTFSFPSQMPSSYTGEDALEWTPFTSEQQAAVRSVLSLLQQQVQLTFTEVPDTGTEFGVMRFSNNRQTSSSGYAIFPNAANKDTDSDTWIALGYHEGLPVGSYNWMTLVHEIGHAIGLNHPGNYNAGEARNSAEVGNFLSEAEDAFFNSIMSYRHSAQSIQDTWFMPYDMLALRYLYGSKAFASGDTVYTYQDSVGLSVSNIVDDGGIDTLDFSALSSGVQVNLTPGAYSSVGKLESGAQSLANLTTAFDAVVEHVVGTASADLIQGNQAANTFTPGLGDDGIDGGAGIDTVVLGAARAAYTLTRSASGLALRDTSAGQGMDTLSNVERLRFADDSKLALDLDGHAGQVARLLGVALGKDAVANASYVGIGLNLLDGGMSFEALAQALMTALGKTTPADALSLLWMQLLGTAPDAAQVQGVLSALGNPGVGALTVVAANLDLTAQLIGLAGLTDLGLLYS